MPVDVGMQDFEFKILITSSWAVSAKDDQAWASTDKTRSAQEAEYVISNSVLAAATSGSVRCRSQSATDNCFQGKTDARTSGSNEPVTLIGSRVLGRGPSVGMIDSPLLEFKNV